MKLEKHIKVYFNKQVQMPNIRLVQFDTGVSLVFHMMDFEAPEGTSATIYVRKPSGKFVYQEDGITVSGKTITIDIENQAMTEEGKSIFQVKLENGNDTISTFAGNMVVERSIADKDAVESETVASAFDKKMADMLASTISATHDGKGNVKLSIM